MLGLRPEWPSAVLRGTKSPSEFCRPRKPIPSISRRPVPPNRFAAVVAWLEACSRLVAGKTRSRAVRISENGHSMTIEKGIVADFHNLEKDIVPTPRGGVFCKSLGRGALRFGPPCVLFLWDFEEIAIAVRQLMIELDSLRPFAQGVQDVETTTDVQELGDVWGRIRQWPEPIQLELASRILQSVRQAPSESSQQGSFADLIGLWDKGQPQFSDEQLDQILAEERTEKHADIQLASAVTAGVDAIVTRDAAGFTSSPIPVLTPQQLLPRIMAG